MKTALASWLPTEGKVVYVYTINQPVGEPYASTAARIGNQEVSRTIDCPKCFCFHGLDSFSQQIAFPVKIGWSSVVKVWKMTGAAHGKLVVEAVADAI